QHDGFGLLAQLLLERFAHLLEIDRQQPRQDAVVDHVADETPQLRIVADRRDELVERNRIEHEVVAQLVELERFVVDDRCPRLEPQDVLARRLGVHGDEKINFFLATDVPVLVRAYRVPGGQAGDVRREEIFAGYGYAHLKDRSNQDQVGGLTARPVDG